MLDLVERHLMDRSIANRVGNRRLLAAVQVACPRFFGNVQVGVEERVEVPARVREIHRHDAVVDLAGRAAVLALHARRVVALLGEARLVEDEDLVPVMNATRDLRLHPISHRVLVPSKETEELLQAPRRDASGVRHRFDRLALERAELALDVRPQVRAAAHRREAILKLGEKRPEPFAQRFNLVGIHSQMDRAAR